MSVLLGRQRICDGCGKTVFKKYTGTSDDYIYTVDMNKITDDFYFDNSVDNGWVYADYLGDLCPRCVEKAKQALSNIKKESVSIGYITMDCANDENDTKK